MVVVGGLAARAALFGPAEPWWWSGYRRDGRLAVRLCAWASCLAVRDAWRRCFPRTWSIAERRAWVGRFFIGAVLLSFPPPLGAVGAQQTSPKVPTDFLRREFVQRLIVLIVVWSVISHLIGRAGLVASRADERDFRVRRRIASDIRRSGCLSSPA